MFKKWLGMILSFALLTFPALAADNLKTAFTEGEFRGQIRIYYYERDFDERNTREDIAAGGNFYYRTAPLYGVKAGMAFYTAQAMSFNDDDKDVYGLLATDDKGDHESFSVLGEAFIQFSRWQSTLKIGRQEMETPWINTDDNRLTPQSTSGYTLTNNRISGLDIAAGHVLRMRGKADTEFESMTEYAGFSEANEPVTFAGLVYSGLKDIKIQLWDYYAHDYLNNIYFKTDYSRRITDQLLGFCSVQYLDQNDTGDKVGGQLETYMYTLEGGLEINGLTVSLAYGGIGDDAIHYAWGHDLIISGQLNDLGRADETGVMAKVGYDFGKIGIDGLSAKVLYMDFNTPENGRNASPDYTDIDLDIKYKLRGFFEGLAIRARHAIINEDEHQGGEDYTDSRLYVTYDLAL